MKLRTRSYHITGIMPNTKFEEMEHLRPRKEMTREDKVFTFIMIFTVSYFFLRGYLS